MGPNAEAINGVALLVERQNRLLVYVVGRHDHQSLEPGGVEVVSNLDENVPRHLGQVGQISGVDSDPQRPVAKVVEGHGDGGKVQ
jgi:hypothetical protein